MSKVLKEQIEILKQKLKVSENALNKIVYFEQNTSDENYEEAVEIANRALEQIAKIDGF